MRRPKRVDTPRSNKVQPSNIVDDLMMHCRLHPSLSFFLLRSLRSVFVTIVLSNEGMDLSFVNHSH